MSEELKDSWAIICKACSGIFDHPDAITNALDVVEKHLNQRHAPAAPTGVPEVVYMTPDEHGMCDDYNTEHGTYRYRYDGIEPNPKDQ